MFSTTTTVLVRLSSSSIVATPLTVLMSIALSQRRRLSKTNFNSHQSSADDVFPSYYVSPSSSHLFIQFRNYAEAMPGASDNTTNTQNNNNNNTTHPTLPEADFITSCPFRCLGLTRTATKEEVRANYLQLAKVHHPDVGGETKKFRRVQAAYKQSIEMIETGYAAKTAKKEKEANYRAPNERQRNYRGRPGDDDADEEDEQHARKSSYYYRSTRKSGTSSTRDTDASSAASYSYAESSSAFSSGNRRAADRKSNSNNKNNNDNNEYAQKTKSRFSSHQSPSSSSASASYFYSERDRNAKAFNNSDEWFRETYEKSNSSWSTASKRSEAEKKKRKLQQEDAEYCKGRPAYASSSFYKNSRNTTTSSSGSHDYNAKKTGENPSDSHHQREEEARSSSEEDYFNKKTRQNQQKHHQSETEREFGEDEEWFQFKTNFYDMNAKNLTPRDLYRLRFAQATTAKEIDEIYSRAMEENIFSGWDIGEPLHLALERYHLDSQLGLGEKHLEKCFDTIEDWEKRTKSTASCIYYQCILKLYTNEQMLFLFPDIDASIIAEVVWKVLQKMQDKEVSDDTGIGWWNLMNSALMYRDPHGYGNTSG